MKIKNEDQIDLEGFVRKMSVLKKKFNFTFVLEFQRKKNIDHIKYFKQIKIDLSMIFYLLACEGISPDNLFVVLSLPEFGYQDNSEHFFNELISVIFKCIPVLVGGIIVNIF